MGKKLQTLIRDNYLRAGDIVTCSKSNSKSFTLGEQYTLSQENGDLGVRVGCTGFLTYTYSLFEVVSPQSLNDPKGFMAMSDKGDYYEGEDLKGLVDTVKERDCALRAMSASNPFLKEYTSPTFTYYAKMKDGTLRPIDVTTTVTFTFKGETK